MNYDKIGPLRRFLREEGNLPLLMGRQVYNAKVGNDLIVIFAGARPSKACQTWRVSAGNLYEWEELAICGGRYLRIWLARSSHPILPAGPQEGIEHCLELTFRLKDKK